MITRGIVLQSERSIDIEPDEFYDLSRFGNNGASTDVTWVQLPSYLWVMSFNGATSFVNLGNDTSFDFGLGDFSLEIWVRTSSAAWQALADKRNGGVGWWRWSMTAGVVAFETNIPTVTSIGVVNDGIFHHLVVVRSGNNGMLYVDGQLNNTTAGWAALDTTNPAVLSIGSLLPKHNSAHFDGEISPTCICNYALSPGRILQDYEAEKHWFGVHE